MHASASWPPSSNLTGLVFNSRSGLQKKVFGEAVQLDRKRVLSLAFAFGNSYLHIASLSKRTAINTVNRSHASQDIVQDLNDKNHATTARRIVLPVLYCTCTVYLYSVPVVSKHLHHHQYRYYHHTNIRGGFTTVVSHPRGGNTRTAVILWL